MEFAFDWTALHWIQENLRCDFLDFVFPKITVLANAGALWILIALLLLCSKKYRKYGVYMAICLVVGFLTGNLLLKNLIARERPCWIDTKVLLLIQAPKDFSFPSGHSLHSFLAAVCLFKTKRRWGNFALVLASLIAFSRLYLYVHFPTDVLAGILLGIAIPLIVFPIAEKCRRKRKKRA